MEGCPLGTDERLLALASPPLYTPFPNPYVSTFLSASHRSSITATKPYSREPIAMDITEGKTDPAYLAQSYHTKVPYRAITRYIEHFTDPGDLVLDGFCGSGMVGVACNQTGRRALLCDLSPAATFLAHSYCHPLDLEEATAAFEELLRHLQEECGWLYHVPCAGDTRTGIRHQASGIRTQNPGSHSALRAQDSGLIIDYVIWSEVFRCPYCGLEFPFSESGFDFDLKRPHQQLICPSCGDSLQPNRLSRVLDVTGRTREVPVRVSYTGYRKPRELPPDDGFLRLQREIEDLPIPHPFPDNPMMNRVLQEKGWGDMWRRGYHHGMERVSDFYFKRTLWVLATAQKLAWSSQASPQVKQLLLQVIVNCSTSLTRMRRAYQGVLPLVMYVPKLKREVNVIRALTARYNTVAACLGQLRRSDNVLITTQSTTSLTNVPDNCVDYIFTDPPFGDNIRYSEVNFLWEAWLGVFTQQGPEAIISPGQAKGVAEYQRLMQRSFSEMHRVLKPDRWITVAFHNSDRRVWNAIQQALQRAGFEIAEVRMLDKRQVSFKQASANTVRRDLVISARKVVGRDDTAVARRREDGERGGRGDRDAGTDATQTSGVARNAESAWNAVRERLAQLPISADNGKKAEGSERGDLALFNYMVASHIKQGLPVPIDARRFRAELPHHFERRDGDYFLPEQIPEYDRAVTTSSRKI